MALNTFTPTTEEMVLADTGYINYAIGLAIMNDPFRTRPIHGREVEIENIEIIIAHAETLMVEGLRDVIALSNPSELRSPLSKTEKRYQEALPHVLATVNRVYANNHEQLAGLNPGLAWVRPNPLIDKAMYHYLARGGRYEKITLRRLMYPFLPAVVFERPFNARLRAKSSLAVVS